MRYTYNKRREERIPFKVGVTVTSGSATHTGTALNSSRNGALIEVPGTYTEGDSTRLEFKTDLASIPAMSARVVRAEPDTFGTKTLIGVKFSEPNPSLTDIIKLEKRLKEG